MKPLLLCLTLLPTLAAPSGSSYFAELPEHYRRRFESGDKFSTVVAFVREAVSNASSSGGGARRCLGTQNRSRFPLTAFSKEESERQRPVHYRGFDRSVRSVLSIANLFNYIYQLANRPFEAWFRVINEADGYNALWYSVASSIVASDSRVFGCYVVLLNDSSVLETVPHAFRHANSSVLIENYAQRVSIAGPPRPDLLEPGFEWLGRQQSHQIAQRPSEPADEDEGPDIPAAVYFRPAAAAGHRGEDGGLGGQVKVVTEAEGFWNPPVFVCRLGRWLFSYAVPFLSGQPRSLAVKGWIVLEFDINELEVNQCLNDSTFGSFYANDVCNQATTECSHIPGMGFTDQNFMCKCRKYFHHGNFTESK
uniref:G-protein coupled receptor 158 n=1 Tax=Macrostomum lignano TaxID=282301 RepID=A0A1I8JKT7_9PLAT